MSVVFSAYLRSCLTLAAEIARGGTQLSNVLAIDFIRSILGSQLASGRFHFLPARQKLSTQAPSQVLHYTSSSPLHLHLTALSVLGLLATGDLWERRRSIWVVWNYLAEGCSILLRPHLVVFFVARAVGCWLECSLIEVSW
jgi:hypothetical protein